MPDTCSPVTLTVVPVPSCTRLLAGMVLPGCGAGTCSSACFFKNLVNDLVLVLPFSRWYHFYRSSVPYQVRQEVAFGLARVR